MESVDPEILAVFLDDANGCLETLNEGLLDLERFSTSGEWDAEKINALFRAFHSLKGGSGMLGFHRINQLTHRGETLLDLIRSRKISLSAGAVQALFRAVDGLGQLLAELKTRQEVLALEPIFEMLDLHIHGASERPPESNERTPKIDLAKYLPAFLDDAHQAVTSLEATLLEVDQGLRFEGYAPPAEAVNELFRSAHQIKGLSGSMGFLRLNDLTHAMESVLERVRSHTLKFDSELVTALLAGADLAKDMLAKIAVGEGAELEIESVVKQLEARMGVARTTAAAIVAETPAIVLSDADKEALRAALASSPMVVLIRLSMDAGDEMAGMRAFVALRGLERDCRILATSPAEADLPSRAALNHVYILATADRDEEHLRTSLELEGVQKIDVRKVTSEVLPAWEAPVKANDSDPRPTTTPAGGIQTMRVDVDRLDRLLNMAGELVINKARFLQVEAKLRDAIDQRELAGRLLSIRNELDQIVSDPPVASTLGARLAGLLQDANNAVQSLGRFKALRQVHVDFTEAVHQMDLASNGIQRAIMDIRMVPVSPLFGRFKRVIRDISHELDKDIQLILQGEDTELDKKMADELSDPLTHLVRNAADHGIESKAERERTGKSRGGTITLNAFHKGNRVFITVSDDGKGIDAKFLRRKAVERGLMSSEEAEKMDDREAIHLIFHPGFSTAQKVTSISGRGVGMDIVRRKIEDLSGTIDIETEVGRGTVFRISLPLTLAIQKSLLCMLGETVFAMPLESVVEIVNVAPDCRDAIRGQSVIRVRDKVVPVRTFSDLFPRSLFPTADAPSASNTLVVLGADRDLIAVEVHRLLGEEDIVVKSLAKNLGEVYGVAGASILGNGKVALILDVAAFFERKASSSETIPEREMAHA